LLKLSGIGPFQELHKFGIDVVADLPGVGENLQDRYELAVNVTLNEDIELYTRCQPGTQTDPCAVALATGQWQGISAPFFGPYANNAAYTSRVFKSKDSVPVPDLFLVGQTTSFHGFFPGFSQMPFGRVWTWLVLKAHTNNTSGTVTLRSADPRQQPEINFRYFHEGNDFAGDDLDAVVKGVKLARSFNADPMAKQHIEAETYPGPNIDKDSELRQHIKDNAWGHHASCTTKIGANSDRMAVLDSSFRVRGGIQGLRVVDACAFPRIPGFFPVASVMMIGEKAGDVILEQA
jgi:choline dehydrogenase